MCDSILPNRGFKGHHSHTLMIDVGRRRFINLCGESLAISKAIIVTLRGNILDQEAYGMTGPLKGRSFG